MKIDRKELLNILKMIRPGISTKGIIEEAECFIFTGEEILTFNDKISICYPFKTDFQCLIKAQEFYKILSEIDCNELLIKFKNDTLTFKTNKVKVKLNVLPSNDENIIDVIRPDKKIKWKSIPDDFIEGIKLCMFSASKDLTYPALSCVYVNENNIVSSDNMRLGLYEMETGIKDSFLLPVSSVQELIKFKIQKYAINESWVYFKTKDGVMFCSRILSEEYPDCMHFFEVKGTKFKIPKEAQKSISVSSILAEGDFDIEKRIEISIEDGKLTCKGERSSGSIESTIDIKFKKEKIVFSINPDFFYEILNHAVMAYHNENTMLFKSGKFRHLVSLFGDE